MITVVVAAAVAVMPAVVWMVLRGRYANPYARLTPARVYRSFVGYTVFVCGLMGVIAPAGLVCLLMRRQSLWFHRLLTAICRLYMHLVPGVRFDIRQGGRLRHGGPKVIVSNHQGVFDLIALVSISPRMIFMVSDRVWRNPLLRLVVRPAGFVPAGAGIGRAEQVFGRYVADGYSVAVFPEGTRCSDGQLHRYRNGAFVLAAQLGLDIVPVAIYGSWQTLPKDDAIVRRGTVHVEVLEPIAGSEGDYGVLRRRAVSVTADALRAMDERYRGDYPDSR